MEEEPSTCERSLAEKERRFSHQFYHKFTSIATVHKSKPFALQSATTAIQLRNYPEVKVFVNYINVALFVFSFYKKNVLKVAQLDFLGAIPPKFKH